VDSQAAVVLSLSRINNTSTNNPITHPSSPLATVLRHALLHVDDGVKSIRPRARCDSRFTADEISLGDIAIQDRLSKRLILCLDKLCGIFFVIGAKARSFAGELVNAGKFRSPNVPSDKPESQFHMVIIFVANSEAFASSRQR